MKKAIAAALCLCLTFCLGACSGKDEGLTEVSLCEVTHSVFYAPLYAALELGYFEEEGLDITLTNGGGADKVMTAVLADQADIGLAGPEACIYVLNEGRENYPVIFSQLTKRDGSFLVGRKDVDFSWDMLKGSTIIGGRKGGVPEMTLEYVLRQNGLEPGQDITVDTSVQFDMMAGAFTGGNGDYVTLFEPTATEIELAGKGYILTSIGTESGEIPYTAFFASKNYIKENPETIQSFTNAIAKGLEWIAESGSAKVAQVLSPQFPDTDLDILAKVIERHIEIDAWNNELIMKEDSLERLETVMEQAGELDERADYDILVDNSFAEKALAGK